MRFQLSFASLCAAMALTAPSARALPDLYKTAASGDGTAIYTIYKDASDPNVYWVPYDSIRIVKDADGTALLSMVHWGITSPDVDGTGASLTFTAEPSFQDERMRKAIQAIKSANPAAKFAPLPIADSEYELIMDDRFVYGSTARKHAALQGKAPQGTEIAIPVTEIPGVTISTGAADIPVPETEREPKVGGAGAAPQAFSMQLERLGGRAIAAERSTGAQGIVVRYRYKVVGVGPRLLARLTVQWKKLLRQFQADASVSAYGGAVNANLRAAYQSLKKSGAVSLEILDGGVSENDGLDAYIKELYDIIAKAYINGTGIFQAELKPASAPDLPKGTLAKAGGWGANASIFAQELSEELSSTFEIDKKELAEQWFSVGFSLGSACEQGSVNFTNLTDSDAPCISGMTIGNFMKRVNDCIIQTQAYVKELEAAGVAKAVVEQTQSTYLAVCQR